MATFTAYSRFDYRFFGLFSDYFDDDSATISGTTSVSISDEYSLATITGTSLSIGQYGLSGYANSIAMSNNGESYFKITGLNYNFNNDVYDAGYQVSGITLYGDLAELAYVMSGNDTLIGSNYADRLAGFNGTDTIKGGNGNDVLEGWDGNDKLYGQAGKDILTGGAGSDYFVFDTALNASTNLDTIKDFALTSDKIVLDDDIFKAFAGKSAVSSSQLKVVNSVSDLSGNGYLTYVKANDTLYYDSNGSGNGDVAFVKVVLSGTTAPSASDFQVIA